MDRKPSALRRVVALPLRAGPPLVLVSLFAAELQRRQPWRALAACRGADADVFFEDASGNGTKAQRICGGCPVIAECLVHVLEQNEEFGVWGGAGEHTRRALRSQSTPHAFSAYDEDCDCGYCTAVSKHLDRLLAPIEHRKRGERVVSFGPNASHGKASTAARGCKCLPCLDARAVGLARQAGRQQHLEGEDLEGYVQRRIERRQRITALVREGRANDEIVRELGDTVDGRVGVAVEATKIRDAIARGRSVEP